MKILYVARHRQLRSNDDEGAITFALNYLRHSTVRMHESECTPSVIGGIQKKDFDLVLIHKFPRPEIFRRSAVPVICWYFDLVRSFGDVTLIARDRQRVSWMAEAMRSVRLMFCTDGDWVADAGEYQQPGGASIHWLPQGADEQMVGRSTGLRRDIDLMMPGIGRGGGIKRVSFIEEMARRWGHQFHHVDSGIYGAELRDLVGRTKIVVAPDFPLSDRYWSNRVYLMAGFGGCVLHPLAANLRNQFAHREEIIFYRDREELHGIIGKMLAHPIECERIGTNALARVRTEHLYRHRVAEMLKITCERLGIHQRAEGVVVNE